MGAALAGTLLLAPAAPAAAAPSDLDTTFSGDGIYTSQGALTLDVEVQQSGRVILARSDGVILGLKSSGALDLSFGNNGQISGSGLTVRAIAIDSQDRLLLSGSFTQPFVSRFTPDGQQDDSFGDSGTVQTDRPFRELGAAADGSVLGASQDTVSRLEPNGDPDLGFSGDGTALASELGFFSQTNPVSYRLPGYNDLVPTPGGGVILSGSQVSGNGSGDQTSSGLLLSVTAGGQLNTSFSGDGRAILGTPGSIPSVERFPDGRLAAATVGNPSFFSVVGQDGEVIAADTYTGGFVGRALAIQANSRIVVAGTLGGVLAVARYYSNTVPDDTYAADGRAAVLGGGSVSPIGVEVDSLGRIVVAGSTFQPDTVFAARLLGDYVPPDPPDPPDPPHPPYPSDPGDNGGGSGAGGVAGETSAGPGLEILSQRIPSRLSQLARKGISVRARCAADCRIFIRVAVSRKQAKRLGLPSPVIAGAERDAAGGQIVTLVSRLSATAKLRLLAANPKVLRFEVKGTADSR